MIPIASLIRCAVRMATQRYLLRSALSERTLNAAKTRGTGGAKGWGGLGRASRCSVDETSRAIAQVRLIEMDRYRLR